MTKHPEIIDDTAVFDVGESIIGVHWLRAKRYRPFYGEARVRAAARLIRTATIVTYGGLGYDLPQLARVLGLSSSAPELLGKHVDMQEICWSPRIYGSNLTTTYLEHGRPLPEFPGIDEYEADNRRDVAMTLALWRHYNRNTLRVLDGNRRSL
jgi:hypothetical protein